MRVGLGSESDICSAENVAVVGKGQKLCCGESHQHAQARGECHRRGLQAREPRQRRVLGQGLRSEPLFHFHSHL